MLKTQRTEKILFGTLSVLLLVLGWNFFAKDQSLVTTDIASAESGSGSEASGSDNEESGKSSDSQEDSGDSANSEDDTSEPSTASTPSVKSAPARTQTTKVAPAADTVSEKSTSQEGVSVASVEVDGQLEQESVKSLKSEDSTITTVSTEGNMSVVKRDGKLFFLIPVEIESQVSTDESGKVVMERKNFINWLKDIFSF